MVIFENVTKIYDDEHVAVDELNLEVEEGEFIVLIGPSGCGKTTTLQMINRLVEPTSGRILINGEDHRNISAVELRRNMGYVIQDIALFPHMTVAQNISIVPDLKGWSRERKMNRARELLELVDLDPDIYMDRYPAELSGGQQQRIGVLRALALDPDILLMDEPFGALDPLTREQIHEEMKELQDRVNKTIIFVTHDMDEALKLADRIVLMRDGRPVQIASPEEMLKNPANEFVSEFIGNERRLISPLDVQVRELMIDEVPWVYDSDNLGTALSVMQKNHTDYLAVVDDDQRYVGLLYADRLQQSRMSRTDDLPIMGNVELIGRTVDPKETMMNAVHLLARSQEEVLAVVDKKGKVRGAISRAWLPDILARELWPIEALGNGTEEE